MKFGRLDDASDVDFSLPPDDPRSLEVLKANNTTSFHAYVGMPRWASKEWLDVLYPKGTRQADFLYHYSRSFNTIELNSTHYRIPELSTIEKWVEQVPAGFLFCPKIPQSLSHYRKLDDPEQSLRFQESIATFGEHLGCSFVQLHPSFGPDKLDKVANFLTQWSAELPLAIEFRHPDWYAGQQLIAPAFDLLANNKVATVVTDVAGRRDIAHTSLTSSILMIRFVGDGPDPTDHKRWNDWMSRIKRWKDSGLKDLYVFVHEPGDLNTANMGAIIVRTINQELGLKLDDPISAKPGSQTSLF